LAAAGEAADGEDDVILLREEGRRRSGRRSVGHPRMTTAVAQGKGRVLADDGRVLVDVGGGCSFAKNGGCSWRTAWSSEGRRRYGWTAQNFGSLTASFRFRVRT
jgi:hypothetical protein